MKTLKAILFSLLVTAGIMGPIIGGCILYDTPERRAANEKERTEWYQNSFQECRNFCVSHGAESFMYGRSGPGTACLCGGGLP